MRERAIANTGDLFRGSSTLAIRPRLQHYEGFPLKTIPPDHSVRNTYERVHTRTPLDSLVPLLFPQEQTHASTLACRGRTSYNFSNHTSEYLAITSLDHHKTLFIEATTSTTPQNTRMKTCDHFPLSQNNSHNKNP